MKAKSTLYIGNNEGTCIENKKDGYCGSVIDNEINIKMEITTTEIIINTMELVGYDGIGGTKTN